MGQGVGDEGDGESVSADVDDGEANTIYGDTALGGDEGDENARY